VGVFALSFVLLIKSVTFYGYVSPSGKKVTKNKLWTNPSSNLPSWSDYKLSFKDVLAYGMKKPFDIYVYEK
jgi:hypothetical protein